jgi:hypothetical protein
MSSTAVGAFMDSPSRFWPRTRGDGECLLWIGSVSTGGYGRVYIKRRVYQAHRVAWELIHGSPVPDGMFVLHNCPTGDNALCVRPGHLWLGTQLENILDMWAKGRGSRHGQMGESNVNAKLTRIQAAAIRQSTARGMDLALEYGVSRSLISRIRKGKAWAS